MRLAQQLVDSVRVGCSKSRSPLVGLQLLHHQADSLGPYSALQPTLLAVSCGLGDPISMSTQMTTTVRNTAQRRDTENRFSPPYMAYLGPSCLVAFRELFSVHLGTLTPQTSHMTPGRAHYRCDTVCQKESALADRHTHQFIQFRRMQLVQHQMRVAPRRAARDTHAALLLACMAAIPLCSVQTDNIGRHFKSGA